MGRGSQGGFFESVCLGGRQKSASVRCVIVLLIGNASAAQCTLRKKMATMCAPHSSERTLF